ALPAGEGDVGAFAGHYKLFYCRPPRKRGSRTVNYKTLCVPAVSMLFFIITISGPCFSRGRYLSDMKILTNLDPPPRFADYGAENQGKKPGKRHGRERHIYRDRGRPAPAAAGRLLEGEPGLDHRRRGRLDRLHRRPVVVARA